MRLFLAGVALLALASFVVHPFGSVKAQHSGAPVFTGASVDPEAMRIIEQSCQNCHSDRTQWPWYSYVAPMSWMVEKDVNAARSHMNLSRWNEYDTEQRLGYLSKMALLVKRRAMPLPRYLLLHPEARLTDAQIATLYQWARRESRRLSDQ